MASRECGIEADRSRQPSGATTLLGAHIAAPRNARSKSWDEFALTTSLPIAVVLTVCDNAANETCPHFPGPARKLHLPFPDPAAAIGSDADKLEAFKSVFTAMRPKLDALMGQLLAAETS
jgi:protein-tyrosine-phosphatase